MKDSTQENSSEKKHQLSIDEIRKGNTLDFYNDDLPRKAVGKLFDEQEEELADAPPATPLVKGYHDDSKSKSLSYESLRLEVDNEHSKVSNSDYDPIDDFEIKEVRKQKNKPLDDEYDLSFYRSKSDQNLDDPASDATPLVASHVETKLHRKHESDFQTDKAELPIREQKLQTLPKGIATLNTTSQIRIGVSILFFILLVLLAALVFRTNSLNKKLLDAEKSSGLLMTQLQSTNDKLSNEVKQLKKELEEAKTTTTTPITPASSTGETPEQTEASGTTTTDQTPAATGITEDTTYTVVNGDNLSKVSKKFYGSPNHFQKIMDANSMTSESIKVGQVLKIPK